jgi:hypothetical protein
VLALHLHHDVPAQRADVIIPERREQHLPFRIRKKATLSKVTDSPRRVILVLRARRDHSKAHRDGRILPHPSLIRMRYNKAIKPSTCLSVLYFIRTANKMALQVALEFSQCRIRKE